MEKKNWLFQRRQIWIPTLLGWALLLTLGIVGSSLAVLGAYPFLAQQDPAPSSRLLVVEGWMAEAELDQAITAFQRGGYERLVTTGGTIERYSALIGFNNFADLAAAYIVSRGVASSLVTAVPAPASAQDRTYLSAVKVREWARKNGLVLNSLDVFSGGPHARRSRKLFQLALGPKIQVGVLTATPSAYDRKRWWNSSAGAKSVLTEAIAWAWISCCFSPPAEGSYQEAWGVSRQAARQ
jgi:hypothetical protein